MDFEEFIEHVQSVLFFSCVVFICKVLRLFIVSLVACLFMLGRNMLVPVPATGDVEGEALSGCCVWFVCLVQPF